VARRRATERPSGDGTGLVMPAEIAIYRPGEWSSSRDHAAAEREWLSEHGVDPGDWSAVHPILCASRRAHARTKYELCSLDRLRVTADPEACSDWWPPPDAA